MPDSGNWWDLRTGAAVVSSSVAAWALFLNIRSTNESKRRELRLAQFDCDVRDPLHSALEALAELRDSLPRLARRTQGGPGAARATDRRLGRLVDEQLGVLNRRVEKAIKRASRDFPRSWARLPSSPTYRQIEEKLEASFQPIDEARRKARDLSQPNLGIFRTSDLQHELDRAVKKAQENLEILDSWSRQLVNDMRAAVAIGKISADIDG